jgi:hypothetical protein
MTPEVERELVGVFSRALSGESDLSNELEKIQRLTAALEECRLYLVNRVDVLPGPSCRPKPNRAMRLVKTIDRALGWA